MFFKVSAFILLICLGLLLLNNGVPLHFGADTVQLLRIVGGIGGLLSAVALMFE